MSVQAPHKTKVYDDYDFDDDDGPITFKRNSTTSRQNQSNSEVKKHSVQSSRPISVGVSLNGGNSITQKGKVDQSNKSSGVKSPIVSPKASTLASKVSPVKPSTAMPKASTSVSKVSSLKPSTGMAKASTSASKVSSLKPSTGMSNASTSASKVSPLKPSTATPKASTSSGQLKNPSAQAKVSVEKKSSVVTEEKKSSVVKEERKSSVVTEEKKSSLIKEEKKSSLIKEEKKRLEDSDEDDDKPLSARCKGNVGKPITKSIVKENPEDSNEKPLRSSFQMKSGAGTSSSKYNDCDDKKPLSSFSRQNGVTPAKRPLDKQKVDLSSIKKQKKTDSSPTEKNKQVSIKPPVKEEDDDDHVPISHRIKKSPAKENKSSSTKQKIIKPSPASFKKKSNSFKKPVKNSKTLKNSKYSKSTRVAPGSGDGQKKWTTLSHHGVIFPPPYTPHGVKMLYNGNPVDLTPSQEEVATMYAVMKDTEYVQKKTFRDNFWNDWRKLLGRNHVIQKLEACDFSPIYDWCQSEKEKKKQMTTEEKKAVKEEKLQLEEKYMWAVVDGVKEKVGNFRVEPPGLFRGRGEHPKSGKLKRRIFPSDVTINIGRGVPVPECPIPGESWKEIRHDDTVTWLAYWLDPINQKEFKYVFLAASSSLKGQSDKEKYEKARKLKDYIHNIRAAYTKDFTSKDVSKRQVAVATYLIDKLALRAGNEKDDDEADTVGCCTLKVENVKTIAPNKLEFNFLGKDSIKYENTVEVELPVYNAIIQFQTRKKGSDDLFDSLDTSKLNTHLKELMPGLTAKVFRTYNASITLDEMLSRDTRDGSVEDKKTVYNAANKEVAIICNHQRTVSKSHESQIAKLNEKLQELQGIVKDLQVDLDRAKKGKPPLKDADGKPKRNLTPEAVQKKIDQTNTKIEKMIRDRNNREDIKTVALGTSKLNYLDPRITVAWCKRHEVPIEKIFNKSCLSKFAWSMDVDPDFRF